MDDKIKTMIGELEDLVEELEGMIDTESQKDAPDRKWGEKMEDKMTSLLDAIEALDEALEA